MPRRARITVAGVPHHVVQRGHNRQATFFADEDYLAYLHSLREQETSGADHGLFLIETVMRLKHGDHRLA